MSKPKKDPKTETKDPKLPMCGGKNVTYKVLKARADKLKKENASI